jgi:hypothetical protein
MKKLLPWFAALALLIVTFGSIYAVAQQAQRRDANWPQIQIAEDNADALNRSGDPQVLTTDSVDFSRSLQPFIIIYDKNGKPLYGSGYLDSKLAQAPLGMLKAAQGKEYSAVTWEPKDGVRVAAVSVAAKNYYVLSGRNLKEVEKNENAALQLSLLGGIVGLMLFGLIFILHELHTEEY